MLSSRRATSRSSTHRPLVVIEALFGGKLEHLLLTLVAFEKLGIARIDGPIDIILIFVDGFEVVTQVVAIKLTQVVGLQVIRGSALRALLSLQRCLKLPLEQGVTIKVRLNILTKIVKLIFLIVRTRLSKSTHIKYDY